MGHRGSPIVILTWEFDTDDMWHVGDPSYLCLSKKFILTICDM